MQYLLLTAILATLTLVTVNCSELDKISPELYQSFQNGKTHTIIVFLKSTTGTTDLFAPVTDLLTLLEAHFVILRLLNKVVVYNADLELVQKLIELPVVVRIAPDKLHAPNSGWTSDDLPNSGNDDQQISTSWNMELINARCSNITCFGEGVVVGIIDTGVQLEHPELKANWYGTPYGWYDAINATSGSIPSDNNGEGTATISLAVGKTVGVAPKAKWIACKACFDNGTCSQAAYLVCAQFMLCPWDNTKPPPTEPPRICRFRPDIVIMQQVQSSTAQLLEPEYFWFYQMLQVWNDAGIISVTPIGDFGPDCNVGGIPAVYDNAFAVGAVDETGTVMDSSSRGPSFLKRPVSKASLSSGTCPEEFHEYPECTAETGEDGFGPCIFTKPDIVAPGNNISAANIDPEMPIDQFTGTEFAAGHIAGVAALMLCASKPSVKWNIHKAYKLLTQTAQRNVSKLLESQSETQYFPDTSHLMCDVIIGKNCNEFPSNVWGWGLVNACGAVLAAKELIH